MAKNKPPRVDAKAPDAFQKTTAQGYQWLQDHIFFVIALVVAAFVAGLGVAGYQIYLDHSLTEASKALYRVEKGYLQKQQDFERYRTLQSSLSGKKGDEKAAIDEKLQQLNAPSGNIAQDYGPEIANFQRLLSEQKGTPAAAIAGIYLSEIYNQYEQPQESIAALETAVSGLSKDNMLAQMARMELGSNYARSGDCQNAIATWQPLQESSNFLKKDLLLKMALCYEEIDPQKARLTYQKLTLDHGDSVIAKRAQKYLLLLESKQSDL